MNNPSSTIGEKEKDAAGTADNYKGGAKELNGKLATIDGSGGINSHALAKAGAGSLTLGGANTYTGGTAISGGLLALGNEPITLTMVARDAAEVGHIQQMLASFTDGKPENAETQKRENRRNTTDGELAANGPVNSADNKADTQTQGQSLNNTSNLSITNSSSGTILANRVNTQQNYQGKTTAREQQIPIQNQANAIVQKDRDDVAYEGNAGKDAGAASGIISYHAKLTRQQFATLSNTFNAQISSGNEETLAYNSKAPSPKDASDSLRQQVAQTVTPTQPIVLAPKIAPAAALESGDESKSKSLARAASASAPTGAAKSVDEPATTPGFYTRQQTDKAQTQAGGEGGNGEPLIDCIIKIVPADAVLKQAK